MKNYLEIKPNIGFGDFEFGSPTDELIEFFGNPDESEILEDEEFETKIISYWEKGFTFFLEGEDFTYFTCVESDNPDLSLFGQKIIGISEGELLHLLSKNGYTDFDAEDEEWGEKRITFEDLSIDFYFENDELISVSWASPEEDEDEEE